MPDNLLPVPYVSSVFLCLHWNEHNNGKYKQHISGACWSMFQMSDPALILNIRSVVFPSWFFHIDIKNLGMIIMWRVYGLLCMALPISSTSVATAPGGGSHR